MYLKVQPVLTGTFAGGAEVSGPQKQGARRLQTAARWTSSRSGGDGRRGDGHPGRRTRRARSSSSSSTAPTFANSAFRAAFPDRPRHVEPDADELAFVPPVARPRGTARPSPSPRRRRCARAYRATGRAPPSTGGCRPATSREGVSSTWRRPSARARPSPGRRHQDCCGRARVLAVGPCTRASKSAALNAMTAVNAAAIHLRPPGCE